MSRFCGLEVERRIDGERFAEFVAALPLAVRRAMDEGQVLVRAGELLVAQAFADRALEALRRSIVVAGFILLQGELERRRSGLQRREDGPPDGMARLGGRKREVRFDAQGLAEFFAAGAFARRGAMDEGEILVRIRPFAIGEAEIDRRLQIAPGIGIFALFVLAKAAGERGGAFAWLYELAQRLGGAARQRNNEGRENQRARCHRKRCRILT